MEIHPIKLDGIWNEGWALDFHTTSSKKVSEPIYIEVYNSRGEAELVEADGKQHIVTIRPQIAEALFQLKYNFDQTKVNLIAEKAATFLNEKKINWDLDCIIPIPPSDMTRTFQPVYKLVDVIWNRCSLNVNFEVSAITTVPPLNKSREQLIILTSDPVLINITSAIAPVG
jgi:hypothetical protein